MRRTICKYDKRFNGNGFFFRIYGFYDECRLRYTLEIWNLLQAIFNCLPLYARINKNILYAWRNITRHCVMKFAS